MAQHHASVLVIGAGPVGLAAALALVQRGVDVAIAAPKPTAASLAADTRTFAALGGSVDLLKVLGVWSAIRPHIAPLKGIRLIDARGGVFRAPEVLFEAHEAGLDSFGYNIPQAALGAALSAKAATTDGLRWHDTKAVTALTETGDGVAATLADGSTISARLVVAADGRNSVGRAAANIATTAWSYPQTAVACVFEHRRPHQDVSTEFHGPHGPLTTVPMPDGPNGPRSSLVWVDAPERAEALAAMSAEAFRMALSEGLQGLLGSIGDIHRRAAFPLTGLEAATMAQGRIALVGEAGHVLPPIGAQGLNLGLRDAATLADCVEAGAKDPGAPNVITTYARRRASDVWTRTRAIDLLNRSLLSSIVPLDALRGVALHALAASSTLRRAAMRQGLEPIGARPSLMQPNTAAAPSGGHP
jgi:2-octaprenyl-6-methoxyphenol hydroxylase